MNPDIQYLYSLHMFGMKFGLRNTKALLRSIGDPHRSIRTVHVAGTNGKGSTSSMIAAILTAAGYKVGLYTSPHLVVFNERIRINGVMISAKDLTRYVREIRPEADRLKATFFEAATAIAFKYFADQKVDIAVIETGLGGRLDSTNVLKPLVSVITSIGKDHTQYLGKTLVSIAAEKAGIIKRHVPVVIGKISGAARKTIIDHADTLRSTVINGMKMRIPADCTIELKGEHQFSNARTALAATAIIGRHFLIGDRAVKKGLEQTTHLTGLRARCEFRKGTPDILLDVAHNPDGIKTLVAQLEKSSYKRVVILFGVMKDKDFRSILKQFTALDPIFVAAQPEGERALSSAALYRECQRMGYRSYDSGNIRDAISTAKSVAGKKGLLVVTGSHYLVGEVIPLIEKKA